jgi:hypothetical protein
MRGRTSEQALSEALRRVGPAFRRCGILGICAIVAGVLVGGLHEVARSTERQWASLFFLYGAGRGFLVGLAVGVGLAIVIPLMYVAASFIRLRFSSPPET